MNYPRRIPEIVLAILAVILIKFGQFELNWLTVLGLLCGALSLGLYVRTKICRIWPGLMWPWVADKYKPSPRSGRGLGEGPCETQN